MFSAITTFHFGIILGLFWLLGALIGVIFKSLVLEYTHKVEKLLFSVPPSIIPIVVDLFLGYFWAFGDQMGKFGDPGNTKKLSCGLFL